MYAFWALQERVQTQRCQSTHEIPCEIIHAPGLPNPAPAPRDLRPLPVSSGSRRFLLCRGTVLANSGAGPCGTWNLGELWHGAMRGLKSCPCTYRLGGLPPPAPPRLCLGGGSPPKYGGGSGGEQPPDFLYMCKIPNPYREVTVDRNTATRTQIVK